MFKKIKEKLVKLLVKKYIMETIETLMWVAEDKFPEYRSGEKKREFVINGAYNKVEEIAKKVPKVGGFLFAFFSNDKIEEVIKSILDEYLEEKITAFTKEINYFRNLQETSL
jgi:hypothetical protein